MRCLAAFLLALLALAGCTADEPRRNPVLAGELVGGGSYDPATHRGRVTVINFWAHWCAPCRDETPQLVAAYEATKGDSVAFLGVNIRDPNRDQARAFEKAYKVPYPSLYDPRSKLALDFEVPPTGIPNTLILDRAGTVVQTFRTAVLRDELIAAIREAVG